MSDVSPLRDLDKLEELDIRTTQVRDITPLLGLRIRDLDVRNLTLPADQVPRFRAQNPQATVWEGGKNRQTKVTSGPDLAWVQPPQRARQPRACDHQRGRVEDQRLLRRPEKSVPEDPRLRYGPVP